MKPTQEIVSLRIEALGERVGQLSLSVGLENDPEWGLRTVSFYA